MRDLLKEINIAVDDAGDQLNPADSEEYRKKYRNLLEKVQVEYPPPDESKRRKGNGADSNVPKQEAFLSDSWAMKRKL